MSETHFTSRTFFKIQGYDLIKSNHPDDRAHAGAAIIIKSSIKYEIADIISQPFLQTASIRVECDLSKITFCAIYFPPRFSVKCEDFNEFFKTLGSKFLVGGDFNAP